MKKVYLIILLLISISCKKENHFNEKKIEKDVKQTLLNWHLDTKVEIKTKKKSLLIKISFPQMNIKEGERPYYFDDFSNKLLVKSLLKKYSDQFFDFSTIKVELSFLFFKNSNIEININDIEKNHILSYFNKKQFYDVIIFSFNEFTPQDIAFLNSQLKYITKYLGLDETEYWKLIEGLFNDKNNKNEKLLKILIGNLKNNNYELESDYLIEKLSEILDKYNYGKI